MSGWWLPRWTAQKQLYLCIWDVPLSADPNLPFATTVGCSASAPKDPGMALNPTGTNSHPKPQTPNTLAVLFQGGPATTCSAPHPSALTYPDACAKGTSEFRDYCRLEEYPRSSANVTMTLTDHHQK